MNSNVNKHYRKIKQSLKEDIPTSHATIHPNQLRFLRGIAAGETRFSSREATKDDYNQAKNNANVRKYGDAGKDYGYYQNNQNDVKDAVRRGVDPKLASALNGGGKTNNADLDTQTRAMHDYISKNPRFAKAYNTLSTEKPDFEAARKAMQNKWFALKNNAPQVQAAFKSKEQYGPVRDSSEQKALDAHGAYPELTHKAKVSNPTRSDREEPTVQSRDRTDTDKTFGSTIPDVEFRQNKAPAPKEKEEPQIVYEGRVKDIVKAWRIHTRDERRRDAYAKKKKDLSESTQNIDFLEKTHALTGSHVVHHQTKLGDHSIHVMFKENTPGKKDYAANFYVDHSYSKSGSNPKNNITGLAIAGHIRNVVKHFINKYQPNSLEAIASDENPDDMLVKQDVYTKALQSLKPKRMGGYGTTAYFKEERKRVTQLVNV